VETGAPLSEAATWHNLDPHANAYATLLSERSQRIADRLWPGKTPAHQAPLCLKCHVHPNYDQASPSFRKQDGVSCESCHGPAGEWLTPHYRPGWKPALGMVDMKTLYGRANVCATCHVGTPEANVDHDLIAAGHPPLRFEFATYFANLPPHWNVAKDRRANSFETADFFDFEIRAWAIGQMVSSATAFELTAHRADPAQGKHWPEFAELDCFACHHDLQAKSWRQNRDYLWNRKPGSMAINDWYHRTLSIADEEDREDFGILLKHRSKLTLGARKAAAALRRRAEHRKDVEGTYAHLKLLTVFRSVETAKHFRAQPWDSIAQDYLAISALRRAESDNNEAVNLIDAVLQKIEPALRFPPGDASPQPHE
jgi:hypothetical protein